MRIALLCNMSQKPPGHGVRGTSPPHTAALSFSVLLSWDTISLQPLSQVCASPRDLFPVLPFPHRASAASTVPAGPAPPCLLTWSSHSPTSPTFPALALCSACLPNPNTSHFSSLCPGVLGNPGRFPVPAFCLLSSLVQKQQESESCLGCSCCCPGLSAWHAARTLGKPRSETNSFYYHFCTFFSPEDPLACSVSSRSALPVCLHVSLSTPRPPTRPSQHRLIPRATPLRGHF